MTPTAQHVNIWSWIGFFVIWYSTGFFTHKTRWAEPGVRRFAYMIPMAAGFWLIFYSLCNPHLRRAGPLAWSGNGLTIGGMLFAAWARYHLGRYWSGHVTLKEGHKLIRTGPYRLARHPLYTGFLTAVLGSAVTAWTLGAFGGFVLVVIAITIKIYREEALMTREFGDEYAQFKRETAALVPFVY